MLAPDSQGRSILPNRDANLIIAPPIFVIKMKKWLECVTIMIATLSVSNNLSL